MYKTLKLVQEFFHQQYHYLLSLGRQGSIMESLDISAKKRLVCRHSPAASVPRPTSCSVQTNDLFEEMVIASTLGGQSCTLYVLNK